MRSVITDTGDGKVNILGNRPEQWAASPYWVNVCKLLGIREDASGRLEDVASIFMDHGINPPSTVSVRLSACAGVGLMQSLVSGLSCFSGTHHCGSLLDAAKFLSGENYDKPYPGFGHPMHKTLDPRVEYLLSKYEGPHVDRLFEISEKIGVKPNISGVTAATLLDGGVPVEFVQLPSVIGRLIGWSAHWSEQNNCKKKNITFDGERFLDD